MAEIVSLKQLDLNGVYTYADYLMWKLQERVELIAGKIFKMSPAPALNHQAVSANLSGLFYVFFDGKPCKYYAAPVDVILTNKDKKDNEITTVVQPDLIVVCDPEKRKGRACKGAPDLVVEILSLSNSKRDLKIKYKLYEENGVREYWIVNPRDKYIQQFVLEGKHFYLKDTYYKDDGDIASVVFEGLSLPLEKVFNI
jgi:hypothetical protein